MDRSKLRKRQIASQLGVSVQVLEQYLQAKRAEVTTPRSAGHGRGLDRTAKRVVGTASGEKLVVGDGRS